MKKSELRAELKKLDKNELTKLFIAAYDELTPKKKEVVDGLILGGEAIEAEETVKKEPEIDMDGLMEDIDAFVEHAEDGLYYSPNRTVSKGKRSRWRFEAKGYFKSLMDIPSDSVHYDDSVTYVMKMFGILCRANGVYTFRSDDPFRAVFNKTEGEFFPELLSYVTLNGYNDDVVRELFLIICKLEPDRETSSTRLLEMLVQKIMEFGKEEDALKVAMEEYKIHGENGTFSSGFITEQTIMSNNLGNKIPCFIVLLLYALERYEEAYDFYMKAKLPYNTREEERLYVLLEFLGDNEKEWVRIYERGIADAIVPRNTLQQKYKSLANA